MHNENRVFEMTTLERKKKL